MGINTGHVGTSDFVLEPADIEFVLERGRRSLEAFLKYYVASNHLRKKPEYKRYDDLRKDSKCSLVSSSSVQSFESGTNSFSIAVPVANIPAHVLSPLAAELLLKDTENHNFNAPQDKIPVSHSPTPGSPTVNRSKSASSGKSVSISDKVEVIESKERNTSGNSDHVREENESEDDQDNEMSESVFLLDKQSENRHKMNHGKHSNNSTAKNSDISPTAVVLPTDSTTYAQIRGLNKNTANFVTSPNVNKLITKENIKETDVKFHPLIDIHVENEKLENPTTPLISTMESDNAIELQPLHNGHVSLLTLETKASEGSVKSTSDC